jgi:hypothetical protein
MDRFIIFIVFLAGVTGYAMMRGGMPERLTALALAMAYLLSVGLQSAMPARYAHVEIGIMAVDLTLFGVLVALALYADRWWTLWVAAMQGLGAGAHVIKAIDSETIRVVYAILAVAWSYPIVLLLLIGTVRHQQRKHRGGDLDWSTQAMRNQQGQVAGDHNI